MLKSKISSYILFIICFLLLISPTVQAQGSNLGQNTTDANAGQSTANENVIQNGTTIGNITDFAVDGNTYTITAGQAKVRVVFYQSDMFRIRLAPNGNFTDPTDGQIVVKTDFPAINTEWSDTGDYYKISTKDVVLRVYKQPLRFALYESDNETLVWKEVKGLTWNNDKMVQTLSRGANEQFFGGGMQNGRFSHRGDTIEISVSYDWNAGGHPNAAPFYMSTRGYGVFRNTFEPGTYSFTEPVKTVHQEKRFDAFYFYGPGLKDILDGYTQLTGRPFMPPIYGLEMGYADCFNDKGETTMDSVDVVEGFANHDMPLGWILVNDGYGCGYENLKDVGKEIRDRGVQLGLWTENGLPNQKWEVSEAGVRIRKLDVAWVGKGYEFALDACEQAYNGIENNSNARGFVWMVEGWAGAQRCGVMWTGDQYGSWENIRFTIPTIVGSGLSGQAFTSSDIDGIFGGSAETYVRDLQWKMFIPMTYAMSGWAPKDKKPWVYGEPYTSINRKYLKLHERLLPYMYTLSAQAHRTGVPPVRALVLEYPNDPKTWGEKVKYEFLTGEYFLVAPVYKDTNVRHNIYLPEGLWIDYWNGDVYEGKRTVNNYPAPLGKLPLFVKAGAIIPMRAPDIDDYHKAIQHPLTLDIYPKGNSSFTLYMDEGVTTEYKQGEFAEQTFEVSAPKRGNGKIKITVGVYKGEFDNMPSERGYQFTVHSDKKPTNVVQGTEKLTMFDTKQAYESASEGWYYEADERGGIVYVKTAPISTSQTFSVTLRDASVVGGSDVIPAVWMKLHAPNELKPKKPYEITAEFINHADYNLQNVDLTLNVPEAWNVEAKTSINEVRAGEKVTAKFSVTVPKGTKPSDYKIKVQADYTLNSENQTVSDSKVVESLLSDAIWVSELQWTDVVNGWGPVEINKSNGGKTLSLDGQTYNKGLGAHARSEITYDLTQLNRNAVTFVADIGVDDEIPDYGSVVFQVWGDGNKLYDSGVMTGTTETKHVVVNIDHVQTLKLVVTNAGDGKTGDHADWARAKILFGSENPVSLTLDDQFFSSAKSEIVTGTLTNDSHQTLKNVDVSFHVPEEWTVSSMSGTTFEKIKPQESVTMTWQVTTSETSATGKYALNTEISYAYSGKQTTTELSTDVYVVSDVPTKTTYLSDLDWLSAKNGWGPVERDMSNNGHPGGDGNVLTLNGETYKKGLGTHAFSQIVYYTSGNYSKFVADIGIDDEIPDYGSVIFQVWGDGEKLYDSGVMTATSSTQHIEINIEEVDLLKLVVKDTGDGNTGDHADWGIAKIIADNKKPDKSGPQVNTMINGNPLASEIAIQGEKTVKFNWTASDERSGVEEVWATVDGEVYHEGTYVHLTTGTHELVVMAEDRAGNITKKTYEIHIKAETNGEIGISDMKAKVEQYNASGAFTTEEAYRALHLHLTVVGLYVDMDLTYKVIKHMKGFKQLLDYQKENDLITDKAYNVLMANANQMIKNISK